MGHGAMGLRGGERRRRLWWQHRDRGHTIRSAGNADCL